MSKKKLNGIRTWDALIGYLTFEKEKLEKSNETRPPIGSGGIINSRRR